MTMNLQGRKACRSGVRCQQRTFEEILYCVINHSERTADEIAQLSGIPVQRLFDYANPSRKPQVKAFELGAICRAANDYRLLEWIATECWGVFFRLPEVNGAATIEVVGQTTQIVKEVGDVLSNVGEALKSGAIEPHERPQLKKEISEAIAALAQLNHIVDPPAPLQMVSRL